MNEFVIATYIFAACFAVYNIIFFKNKKVIYSLRAKNFIVTDEKKYYIAQLIGGMITTVVLIILAIAHSIFSSYTTYGLACVLIFWVLNFTLKAVCLMKGYASIPGVI